MTRRTEENAGLLFVLSGPSGVGKGAVCRELLAGNPRLRLSVSVTTREPRRGEAEGKSYYFRSRAEFETMVQDGLLLEWAEVYGHFYGTPRLPVQDILAGGGDVLLEIDIQGALKVREALPGCILIFVAPPSEAVVRERLAGRGSETPEVMARRLACLGEEMGFLPRYDYAVVNDTVARAAAQVGAIMSAEHLRASRYRGWRAGNGKRGDTADDERTAP
ncbi:MAG: guanylate kinase [Peptococcaceae bacterium]|jgi:guanylate kinase|nr:guanylate kinase [Peptococcaceae bacterium]